MIYGDEPAMPCVDTLANGERYEPIHTGLTIRQQFAMVAMQGLLSGNLKTVDIDIISKDSVRVADSLIEALNEIPNPNEP